MLCDQCKKSTTKWQIQFYGGICAECSIKKDQQKDKPVFGSWTRGRNIEVNANAKDVLQPFKKDGTVNKKFVEAHGTKTLEKEYKTTRKQILNEAERYG